MFFCILSSPLLCASRDFSSGFSAFSPLFVWLPLLVPFPTVSSASPPLPSVASASSTRQPTPLPLPAPSGFLVPPFSLPPVSRLGGGGLYTWSSAQVLPQAPIGVSSLSTTSPLLSVPHPAVPSSSLPAFQPQGVSGFYPLTLLSCLRLP